MEIDNIVNYIWKPATDKMQYSYDNEYYIETVEGFRVIRKIYRNKPLVYQFLLNKEKYNKIRHHFKQGYSWAHC